MANSYTNPMRYSGIQCKPFRDVLANNMRCKMKIPPAYINPDANNAIRSPPVAEYYLLDVDMQKKFIANLPKTALYIW
ncbi:MAG: hypothetical protein IJX14_00615 [Clostridia bacterium]|nr:hypothetical protein [Clostridia bacterium]